MFIPNLYFYGDLENLVDDFNVYANTVYQDILLYDVDFTDDILIHKLFTKNSIHSFYKFVISEFRNIGIDEIQKIFPNNVSAQIDHINKVSNYLVELDRLVQFIAGKINDSN